MIQPQKYKPQISKGKLSLALASLLILTFVVTVFPLQNYDIFWHLKAGDLIRATKTIPKNDLFSFTTPNLKWQLSSWGSDVIFSGIYHYAGKISGLVIFKGLVLTLIYWLLTLTMTKQNQRSLLLLPGLWLLSLMVGKQSFLVRPQLFSYLFLALYYYMIDHYRRVTTRIDYRLLLTFPLIMILWSNLHPGFAVGYLFLFVFLFFESIKYVLRNVIYDKWGIERVLPGKKLLWLWLIFPLVIAATAVNPFGLNTLLAPLKLFLPAAQTDMIIEWAAATPQNEPVFFMAFIFFSLIFAAAGRWLDLSDLGIILLVSALALNARRFISEYAIIILPLAYHYLDILVWKLKERYQVGYFINESVGQPFLVMALVLGIACGHVAYAKGLPTTPSVDRYPQHACDFIVRNDIKGKMFNTYRWGGYLIFRLFPRLKTFVDGRLLSRRVFKDYIDVIRLSPDWEKILDHYDVKIALTSYRYETGHRYLLNDALLESPRWIMVFDDKKSRVFLRDIPEFEPIIKQHAPLYRQKVFDGKTSPHSF